MSCACCTCAITAERQKGHVYYRCTKKKGTCGEKYLREETLLEQVREIVEQVTLPENWAENMFTELDREKKQTTSNYLAAVRSLEQEKTSIETKLDSLLDLHLDGGIDRTAYVQKKNMLLNQKHDIEQKIQESANKADDRLEPVWELILSSQEAKKYQSDDHKQELPTFLKKIGSNWVLQNRAARWEARKGWRVLRQRPEYSDWGSVPLPVDTVEPPNPRFGPKDDSCIRQASSCFGSTVSFRSCSIAYTLRFSNEDLRMIDRTGNRARPSCARACGAIWQGLGQSSPST